MKTTNENKQEIHEIREMHLLTDIDELSVSGGFFRILVPIIRLPPSIGRKLTPIPKIPPFNPY